VVSLEELINALKENKIAGVGWMCWKMKNSNPIPRLKRSNWMVAGRPDVVITPAYCGYSSEAFL